MSCRNSSLLILALILLSGCRSLSEGTSAPVPFEAAPLAGMVYDLESRPVRGARILVDGEIEALSDINGRFVTEPVTAGSHTFEISRPGFEAQTLSVEFTDRLQVLYVSLVSFDSLLDEAEARLDAGDLQKAAALLDRAATISPDDPALLMLTLAAAVREGDAQRIVELRIRLAETGLEIPPE